MSGLWNFRSAMIFFLVALNLSAQSLDQAWQSYMETSADISSLQENRNTYFKEQFQLKSEGSRLQRSSAWYNAWLNKLLLASNSDRQLVILDSLELLNRRLDELLSRQQTELVNLKRAYEQVLTAYEAKGVMLETERETSRRVGSWLLNQPADAIQLPDYSNLVQGHYENKEIQRLVLADVQQLLSGKIAQLDSLLKRREAEAELAVRLAEFHQDLGLQMEVDQDVQKRDQAGEPAKNVDWFNSFSASERTDVSGADAYTGAGASAYERPVLESVDLNVQRDGLQSPSTTGNSKANLTYLRVKQLEYVTLLDSIKKELNHAP